MEITLEGVVSREIIEAAEKGKIYPHLVCGVDVYMRPEIAAQDGLEINQSKPYPMKKNISLSEVIFFSDRYYRIIHLLDPDKYDSQTTITDVRNRMKEIQAKGAGFLKHSVIEQENKDAAYVLTPLSDQEYQELINTDQPS